VVALKMAGVVNPDGRPAERGARVEPVAWGRPGAPQPGCGAELALRSVGTDPGGWLTRRAEEARAAHAEHALGCDRGSWMLCAHWQNKRGHSTFLALCRLEWVNEWASSSPTPQPACDLA
jgi:hypothetical protein